MFKLEDHVQLFFVTAGILLRFLQRHTGTLTHCDRVSSIQDSSSHLLKIFMDMRTVRRLIEAGISVDARLSVRQIRFLRDQADHVHTESVHALIQPPIHHVKYLIPYFRVVPVQIRLFFRKQMKIVHICCAVILPGRS